MARQIINPPNIVSMPAAYSQAVKVGNMVIISGQVAWDKDGHVVAVGDARAQAEKAYENMAEVLKAAGATFKDIVKITTFVVNPDDLGKLRGVKDRFFEGNVPASTTVCIKQLARPELLIEIEAIAVIE
ncbi:MAG: RidA family protein [Chloroflexi bacterium]|nr:RidA family protein [Chloroflexota bacterium]